MLRVCWRGAQALSKIRKGANSLRSAFWIFFVLLLCVFLSFIFLQIFLILRRRPSNQRVHPLKGGWCKKRPFGVEVGEIEKTGSSSSYISLPRSRRWLSLSKTRSGVRVCLWEGSETFRGKGGTFNGPASSLSVSRASRSKESYKTANLSLSLTCLKPPPQKNALTCVRVSSSNARNSPSRTRARARPDLKTTRIDARSGRLALGGFCPRGVV